MLKRLKIPGEADVKHMFIDALIRGFNAGVGDVGETIFKAEGAVLAPEIVDSRADLFVEFKYGAQVRMANVGA